MRDKLSRKTAVWLEKGVDDLNFLNQIKSKLDIARGRPIKEHTREDFISFFEYAFKAVYGETSKLIIIFLLAYLMNVLAPIVVITFTFAIIRLVAGGIHMDSYWKCLMFTIVMLMTSLISVLVINTIQFDKSSLYLISASIYILSVVLSYLYAPRDVATRRITDPISLKRRKKLTIVILTIITVFIVIKHIDNQLMILSYCTGMLMEMLSLTPVAFKLSNVFYKFDKEGRDI